jgi:arylsulfatase A-like enzyme
VNDQAHHINLTDLAPTFLEAAGLKPLPEMTGRSFLGRLTGREKPGQRTRTFLERERHANVRKGDLNYPARTIRTKEFLYIRNFRPDRWPAGDPELRAELEQWMKDTADPRATSDDDRWDRYPYFGAPGK